MDRFHTVFYALLAFEILSAGAFFSMARRWRRTPDPRPNYPQPAWLFRLLAFLMPFILLVMLAWSWTAPVLAAAGH